MHIGHKIKELMKDRNIEISSFAEIFGVQRQKIYHMLARPDIKFSDLVKTCQILEASLAEFVTDTDRLLIAYEPKVKYGSNNKLKNSINVTGDHNEIGAIKYKNKTINF